MARLKFLLLGLVCVLSFAAGSGSAQTVSIVSGTGQVICSGGQCSLPFFDPLVVVVKDANGNPLPNQTVTWSVSGPGSILGSNQTVTDANGQTSITFTQPGSSSFGQNYLQSAVTAKAGSSSVIFYETTALSATSGALLVLPALEKPEIGGVLQAQAGQTLPGAVVIDAGAPNVAVQVKSASPSDGPSVSCVAGPGLPAGVVLSNSNNLATCDLQFNGKLGNSTFTVAVGNKYSSFPSVGDGFAFEVQQGPPCYIRIGGGNNQVGTAGQVLPGLLWGNVTDCGGNTIANIPVVWTVTQGSATLSNTKTTSNSGGTVSTNATLGGSDVKIQVAVAPGTTTANGTPVTAVFSETVNIVITGFDKTGNGDNQSAPVNTAFQNDLMVKVTPPVPGGSVTFGVASGSATVVSPTASIDANGVASTKVQAGSQTGPVVITATLGTNTVTFHLTVVPPGPTGVSFVNGAGFQKDYLAPCSVATILGTGLAPGIQGVVANTLGFLPLSRQVAGVTIQFEGVRDPAPIYSVANLNGVESINFQVPCEIAPGPATVTINVGGGTGTFNTTISAVAPGIFETLMSDSKKRAVLAKPDGTFVSVENPARKGEMLRMYVTGLGAVTPAVPTNSYGLAGIDSTVNVITVVGVNGVPVRVISAKYASGLIGVYEVTFQVPQDAATGDLPLILGAYAGGFQQANLVFSNYSSFPVE